MLLIYCYYFYSNGPKVTNIYEQTDLLFIYVKLGTSESNFSQIKLIIRLNAKLKTLKNLNHIE